SEGQAQRIAIARGLLRNGSILLLDEPTSSVDKDTEALILQRLAKRFPADGREGTTLIIVTHRESISEICTDTLHITDKL
ncbi:MAG: ATP-binding cassette domain-containing protein, partial [Candidatus Cryptobacteroides sp.]